LNRRRFSLRGPATAALLAVAAVAFAGTPGPSGNLDVGGTVGSGRWHTARPASQVPLTDAQREEIERLRSIGYLAASKPAPALSGVVVHDRARAYQGLNLYSSGDHAGAALMDMDGNVLHEWHYDFLSAWPDRTEDASNEGAGYWRYVYLYDNGDMLGIYEGLGLVKVDKDSRLIWSHYGGEHHALDVAPDGRIYVLTREAHMVPRINPASPTLEDFITILDPDGHVVQSQSVLEAFENSDFSNVIDVNGMRRIGDIFHTNAIRVLDGRLADKIPAFRKGNVLVSLRQLSVVAVVDMRLGKVVWALSGMWRAQHDPKILPDGHMMVFDNKGGDRSSRVIEFDPVTQAVSWTYSGTEEAPFYSEMCGAAQRFPNGDTLITESDYGRAFEVIPDGTIVWEFLNPKRLGSNHQLIATVFEMIRIPPGFPTNWLATH
jgi:hypothetical protein